MKKPGESLFRLIKAMSSHEKRYFKLNSTGKLSLLFDCIEAQKEYDEASIKKKFAKDAYLGKGLSGAKHELQEVLLRTLRNYYAATDIDFELRNMMANIDVLLRKGVYDICYKQVMRLKKLARKHERWIWELEAIRFERAIFKASDIVKINPAYLDMLGKEEKQLLEKIAIYSEICALGSQISHFYSQIGETRKKNKNITPQMKKWIFSDYDENLPPKAELYLSSIKTVYFGAFEQGKKNKAQQHAHRMLALVEKYPHLVMEDKALYLAALANHVALSSSLKNWDESLLYIEKKRKLYHDLSSEPYLGSLAFATTYVSEMDVYNKLGEFEKSIALVPQIEEGFEKYARQLTAREYLPFYCNISYSYFGAGRHKECVKWLNRLINEPGVQLRLDIVCFARIMNLIAHYELGNEDLLSYLVVSTYRFMLRYDRIYKFENIILQFIRRKLPRITNRKKRMDAFKELLAELRPLVNDPFEVKPMEEFDIISWLESKIHNRPFAEIVKEKGRSTLGKPTLTFS